MQSRASSVETAPSMVETPVVTTYFPQPNVTKRKSDPILVGTSSGWRMRLAFLASDIVSLATACGVAVLLTNAFFRNALLHVDEIQLKALGILSLTLIAVAFSLGSFGPIPPRPARQFRGWMIGTVSASIGLIVSLWIFGLCSARLAALILIASSLSLFQAAFQRALCRMQFGKKDWWGTRFIVVGDGIEAIQAFERMLIEPQWGLRPIGIVADDYSEQLHDSAPPYLGRPSQIDDIAKKYDVNRAIFIAHWFDSEENTTLITHGTHRIRQWIVLPAPIRFPSLWLDSCEVARLPGWEIRRHLARPSSLAIKRASDLTMTIGIGLVLLPLVAAIALLVKLTSKGPIFFSHRRIGRDGRTFMAWKFRTMHPDGERLLKKYLNVHPQLAAEWEANHKLKSDPRITWIGRKLRSTSLDELPQLWNVFVGEMSLVGPRPIVAAEVQKYSDAYKLYLKVQPGITGLWQVSGRNNTTYEERVELDTYYVHNWSIWLDFYILACTVKVVLLGEGAY